tara:strand:+ start:2792 stop:3070 length:279 start_codon:yes stop_codon:yes gene_type:complete
MLEKREPEEIVTNEQANATVDLFWEQAFPKPIASRPVICALAKRALKAGYTTEQIIEAFNKTRAFTVAAIEYQLRGQRLNFGETADRVMRLQ